MQFFTDNMQIALFPLGAFIQQMETNSDQRMPQTEIDQLKKENANLLKQLTQMNQLKQDNAALRDQFDTTAIPSQALLPVQVVGMPRVIPNISFPETIIIHAGKKQGVTVGSVIVVKQEVIGIVSSTSSDYATVQLVSNPMSSFSVKTSSNGAIGVAKGQGNGELIIDNIVLSDTISVNDSMVTTGNQSISGDGYPANLIVGKVVSVDKNPSSLFQKARIVPLVRFDHLSTVFVIRK